MNNQMLIDFSPPREAGRLAADRCAEKAENRGWDSTAAAKFILSQLHRHGQMSAEKLTDAAKSVGFRPHDDRAFGAVYAGMVRRNEIRCVGGCEREKGHGTAGGRIWTAVL